MIIVCSTKPVPKQSKNAMRKARRYGADSLATTQRKQAKRIGLMGKHGMRIAIWRGEAL